jgi:hypothetical protein
VVNKGAHVVTVDAKPPGPIPNAASAVKVPEKGGAAAPKPVPPKEDIVVLIKLSPEPPLRSTRFRFEPLGACIPKVRSPSKFINTLLRIIAPLRMVAPAGIPATLMMSVAPARVLSGTVNGAVELKLAVTLVAGIGGAVSIWGGPQTVDTAGVIEKADGPGPRATVVVALMLQVPLVATRVYTPAVAVDMAGITGVSDVEVKPPGPDHVQLVAPPPTEPVSVIGVPAQAGPELIAETITGQGDQRYT